MNNKYVKYFLIVAVIAVWATIIYRIAGGLSSGTQPIPPSVVASGNELKISSDTFALNADYPDPFLPDADSAATDTVTDRKVAPPLSAGNANAAGGASHPPTPESVAGIIQLGGIIANPQKRSRIAIITLRGKEHLVREKERIEDIYIKSIGRDKIRILYKGEIFTIGK
ncbi:MAG TPA: hypothetical protein VNW04_23515 [Puia sp.]|jgi:hypothetical protein|nr:hypothetical protein [Puia sp.]